MNENLTDLQRAKLRIALIKDCAVFMESISDQYYVAYTETELRRIASILNAKDSVLLAMGKMRHLWPPEQT